MNDALRAAVFERDKGICSFSGLSVWYLDYGTAPFSHPDWIDHIKPRSRGGTDTLDNLVCASFFYNRKKLNNSSDKEYLFKGGKPTDTFFMTHGNVSQEQSELLKRHQGLVVSDWYFNRAIFNIMVAIGDELAKADVVRTRGYWLTAAQKRMAIWRRMTGGDVESFTRRGLVHSPNAEDIKVMLSLAECDEGDWIGKYHKLLRIARSNASTFERFLKANNQKKKLQIIRDSTTRNLATSIVVTAMKKNAARI